MDDVVMPAVQRPVLLEELDANYCISSKWIAKAFNKPLKEVHQDIRRVLLFKDGTYINHQVDSRGYVTSYLIPLSNAIYLVSRYEGERAEKARTLVMQAIDFFIYERPQLEQRLAWLESDNAALAANQKRKSVEPKPIRVRRIYVPFLVATLTGIRIELRKRAKNECESWQWEIGLVPWAAHAIEALQQKIDDAIVGGEKSLMERFLPTEFSNDASTLREAFEALTKDMRERPNRYIKSRVEVLSA